MNNIIDEIITSLKIFCVFFLAINKNIFRRYLFSNSNFPKEEILLLNFSIDPIINRCLIGYCLFFSKRKFTQNGKLGVVLFVGLVSGIDNILDLNKIEQHNHIEEFERTIYNQVILDKSSKPILFNSSPITVFQFKTVSDKYIDKNFTQNLDAFFSGSLKSEFELRKSKRLEINKHYYYPLDTVISYKEKTTIEYIKTGYEYVQGTKTLDELVNGVWVLQYLDDCTDIENDFEKGNPNLFISYLAKNNELENYINNKEIKVTKSEVKNVINKYINHFSNLSTRLLYRAVNKYFIWRL